MIDENTEKDIADMVRIARQHDLSSLRVGNVVITLDNGKGFMATITQAYDKIMADSREREAERDKRLAELNAERDERDLKSRLPRLPSEARD